MKALEDVSISKQISPRDFLYFSIALARFRGSGFRCCFSKDGIIQNHV